MGTQGASLRKDGETVAVRVERQVKLRVPIHTLSGIVCFGRVACSPFLLGMCAERGVGVSFLSEHGRFLARIQGPVSGNVLLRRAQYRLTDDTGRCAAIARAVVMGKVANCRTVLQRALRERREQERAGDIEWAALRLKKILEAVAGSADVDVIRGHEGDAARVYFDVFDALILVDKDNFYFRGRSRRPPLDNMNALLSFLYTLLTHDMTGAIETVGLDAAVGYLHRERPGRPSLALDLVEELRPVLADRLALTLVNRQQVTARGFRRLENGAIVMDEATRRTVLAAWQERKREEVVHPFLGESAPLGLTPFLQATLLARHVRGDLDGYPCFFLK